ncbi:hypothetical protein OIU84_019288 [Salix udensis]|uniref:DNA-directed RNA polymerase n=1 Tax=Salix udensis TaxID=889485 RepID=A0AAD6KYS9_9ROSI|nr:hypothetical protein OIU84_019288 [Salix udensis]
MISLIQLTNLLKDNAGGWVRRILFNAWAVCINLSEALRSPSPETAISHTPVHQDGSCNGLQHYAALGRDKLGAAAVNLVGGGKPADVYSGIAARVLDIMRRDAEIDPCN